MIRFNKPVKVLEWGEGTNTLNQVWTEFCEGKFVSRKVNDGITTLTIELKSQITKKNDKSVDVKLVQQGEGMSANSDRWGEVAMGNIKSLSGNSLVIEIPYATKISGAGNLLEKFLGLP